MAKREPASIKISLEDHGQDFLWWILDRAPNGDYIVVDCGPFQGWLWCGKSVAAVSLLVGRRPVLKTDDGLTTLKYPIVRLANLTPKQRGKYETRSRAA